jgi:putative lipoic acid-binding regulatory protein
MASQFPPEERLSQNDASEKETLLEFPCKFPVKAMGRGEDGFEALVTDIILVHAKMYVGEQVTINPSGSGKFISVTVTIEALSKDQLDRIYQDLTDCEQVLIAL